MLPKKERLKKIDFVNLKPKVFFRGTYLDIAIEKKPKLLFSCVISKKRVKRAVDRNKIRRKVYTILRIIRPKTPYYVIVYPKLNTLTGNYTHIMKEIQSAFDTL